MINRYWTTFETLVEIETAKNNNSAWEIVVSLSSLVGPWNVHLVQITFN